MSLAVGVVVGVVAGGAAVFLATPGASTRPELKPVEFKLRRAEGNEYVATPQKLLDVLHRYADFDLDATVELSAGTELDVVFHKVSEWGAGADGGHVPPFHTRFHVLRLSTRGEGRAFLSNEEALFEDEVAGLRVQPGRPLTILLEGRGRRVRANVAGTQTDWIETRDDHGNMAFLARGGDVVIKRLNIKPWGTPARLLPFGWGALLGGIIGLLLALVRPTVSRLLVALGLLPLGGLLAWGLLMRAEFLVAADPSVLSVLLAGLCFLPLSALVALAGSKAPARLVARVVAGVLAALLLLEYAARAERPRLQVFEDARLDLYFGAQSEGAPFDALARRLSNVSAIHYPLAKGKRYDVLFLGGSHLFDFGNPGSMEGREVNVVSQVAGHLNVETAAFPTAAPFSYQQQLLLQRFYLEVYRPRVLVVGLTDGEQEGALWMPARELDAALPDADAPGPSALLDLWVRERRDAVPPGGLGETLDDLQALCEVHETRLVLVVDKSLARHFADVVATWVKDKNVPVVGGFDVWGEPRRAYPIQDLVRVLRPFVR